MILDGKNLSKILREEIKTEVTDLGVTPHLVVILVGEDGASETYVNNKVKACFEVGFKSTVIRFPESVTEEEVLDKIIEINHDDSINGLIVQLPLPNHISQQKVLETINPDKDVDGFHPLNVGKLLLGLPTFVPATPLGIMLLLKYYNIETSGKDCVVVGRSHIVGSPVSILLSKNDSPGNCTVTLCHSKTSNLSEHTLKADILIVAVGKPSFIGPEMIKEGAVVVDVGIHRIESDNKNGYKIVGDVDYEKILPKCSAITPVPGGVGPMTITGLLLNTLKSVKTLNTWA